MTGEIECASIADAIKVVTEIQRRAENVPAEPSLRKAAAIVAARTAQNFEASEDPAGNPWTPVKRPTPPPALVRTGFLRARALAATQNPTIAGEELLIDATEPAYGTYHLTGGVRLAKREWLGFTDEQVDEMAAAACDDAVAFVLAGEN